MKIGYRTIKTAFGVPFAIYITQLLDVTNFVSAGILTLLCIQPSRKRSVLSAWDRFAACMLALLFSYIFFEIIGYNPIAIGLMLLLFIPLTVYFNINQGLVTSIVIILNIYLERNLSFNFVIEQVIIISIGVGIGLLLNSYMPNLERRLRVLQNRLEDEFKGILQGIAAYIKEENEEWDQKEIAECEEILETAQRLGAIDRENHLLREEHPYADYFAMRSRQFELLKSMLPLVRELPKQTTVSVKIADFFERLALAIHPGNTAEVYLTEVRELKEEFHHYVLPETYEYEEFATRANLFRLLHEIEAYLLLKSHYKKAEPIKFRHTAEKKTDA